MTNYDFFPPIDRLCKRKKSYLMNMVRYIGLGSNLQFLKKDDPIVGAIHQKMN